MLRGSHGSCRSVSLVQMLLAEACYATMTSSTCNLSSDNSAFVQVQGQGGYYHSQSAECGSV
jgi:hypothetical protein